MAAAEPLQLVDNIETETALGLWDWALIGLVVFTFAHVGAALGKTVADVKRQHRAYRSASIRRAEAAQHALPPSSADLLSVLH